MKIFEDMKAALGAQAPIDSETKKELLTPIFTDTQQASTKPSLQTSFQVGKKVAYKTPIINTPTDYTWQRRHGIVKEISEQLEVVIITPDDAPQEWIGIPLVYVQVYEKNEINEFMGAEDHG